MRKPVILLVGPTGAGKSSLGNLLSGHSSFATSDSAASETKDGKTDESNEYIVNDTMGLNDTAESQVVVRSKITDMIMKMHNGVDVFLLTFRMGRYTAAEHAGFLYLFDAILGPSSYRHCIIVVTHCDAKYVNPITASEAQRKWIAESKEKNESFKELCDRVQSRIQFVCNPKMDDDEEGDSRESKCRRWSVESLQDTLQQFHTGEPFMMAEAKQAQQAYDDKLQQAEQERKTAQAKLLDDARKVGEAAAAELHRIEMGRIEREMKAARDKHAADIQELLRKKDAEIAREREQSRRSGGGGGLFGKIGRVVDKLFGF